MYSLQENGSKPKLNEEDVERCIRGFERQKASAWGLPEVKLEKEQVDAVKALYNPVMCLTGPAGSGKTTIAKVIASYYGLNVFELKSGVYVAEFIVSKDNKLVVYYEDMETIFLTTNIIHIQL